MSEWLEAEDGTTCSACGRRALAKRITNLGAVYACKAPEELQAELERIGRIARLRLPAGNSGGR